MSTIRTLGLTQQFRQALPTRYFQSVHRRLIGPKPDNIAVVANATKQKLVRRDI